MRGAEPSATLLLPYFEVDLENDVGATTLLAVGTKSESETLARVTVWSDWAIPVLSFDLLLRPQSVETFDLRQILVSGRLPVTGHEQEAFPSCTAPLANPALDRPALSTLQAQLRGQPSPGDGLCYGSDRGEGAPAVGYLTIDVLNDCSETVRDPTDPGYFDLTGQENVLYGDVFSIDPSQDLAQGWELVHLAADPGAARSEQRPELLCRLLAVARGRTPTPEQPLADPFPHRWRFRRRHLSFPLEPFTRIRSPAGDLRREPDRSLGLGHLDDRRLHPRRPAAQ